MTHPISPGSIDPKEIRRLWILQLVAEHGTIKRAAVAARLTSSAVSQAISGLEALLDRRLLVRQGDKFTPTAYGQGLLKLAAPALQALSKLHEHMNPGIQDGPKLTSLTLGTTQSLAIDVLPGLVERLWTHGPHVKISLRVGRSAALCAAVRKGELSIALVADTEQMGDLNPTPIAEERMGFYCSANPTIANQGWELVEKLGIGAFPPDSGGYPAYFRKLFKPFGAGWKPALFSESYEALRALAANGSMVAVLSTRVAALDRGDLVELIPRRTPSSAEPPGRYIISLISDRSLDPRQTEFLVQELRAIMRSTAL